MCHLSILHHTCYKLCFFVRTWRPLAMASAECCRGWEEAHEVRLQPAKGKTNVHFDGKIMEHLNISKLKPFFCKALEKDRRNNRIHTKFNLGIEQIIGPGSFSWLHFAEQISSPGLGYHTDNLPLLNWDSCMFGADWHFSMMWRNMQMRKEPPCKKRQTRKHKEKGDGEKMSLTFSCGNLLLLFWPSSWWS